MGKAIRETFLGFGVIVMVAICLSPLLACSFLG